LQQFPSEDGYLMMTIARNLALGRGMSVSQGLVPTNGTQPGFTLIEALCFWLVGGERRSGVLLIEILQLALATLAAWLVYVLGKRVLRGRPWGQTAALVAACTWFASANVVPHTMNCLETVFYVVFVLGSLLGWLGLRQRSLESERPLLWAAVKVGLLLGLTFWARIDAVFLIGALTAVHAAAALKSGRAKLRARLLESVAAGLVSILIASPWLLFNRLRFGNFMPISGTAESAHAALFSNTPWLPATLFRYVSVVLPIPHGSGANPKFIAICCAVVALWGWAAMRTLRRAQGAERWLFAVGACLLAALSAYYGAYFGAAHFLDRYFFPLSPLLALLTVAMLLAFGGRRQPTWQRAGRALLGIAALSAATLLDGRLYAKGERHMHFQVVDWTVHNVAEATWVAAVQTGTLGFFHERTVNLDGKVNPQALAMLLLDRIPEYIVESRWGQGRKSIDYIADWNGMKGWSSIPVIRDHFDLIVDDAKANLAVFRRKSRD
jgi:hypothetical protein